MALPKYVEHRDAALTHMLRMKGHILSPEVEIIPDASGVNRTIEKWVKRGTIFVRSANGLEWPWKRCTDLIDNNR